MCFRSIKAPEGTGIVKTILPIIVLAVGLTLIERLAPAVGGQRILRPGWRTDLLYWLATPAITRGIVTIGTILALLPLFALEGRPFDRAHLLAGFGPAASWPAAVQGLVMVVVGDFIGYWTHRAFHAGLLWRVHAVHHSSERLDWIAAARVHPLNELGSRLPAAIILLGLGFSPLAVAAYQPFLVLYAVFLHANVRWSFGPLRHVIATPAFHRWHHTSQPEGRDRNFAGLLPVWDRLFGTFYLPEGRGPEVFGITGPPLPTGWLAQLIFPFRRWGKR
jgi:sterol desaturase/sphingolipid hydroxylase (fatty acid hydroxylase superfamily)